MLKKIQFITQHSSATFTKCPHKPCYNDKNLGTISCPCHDEIQILINNWLLNYQLTHCNKFRLHNTVTKQNINWINPNWQQGQNCSDGARKVPTLIWDPRRRAHDIQRHLFVINEQLNKTQVSKKNFRQYKKCASNTTSLSICSAAIVTDTKCSQQPNFDSVLRTKTKSYEETQSHETNTAQANGILTFPLMPNHQYNRNAVN